MANEHQLQRYQNLVFYSCVALVLLGIAWELLLAPLRPNTGTGLLPASWILSFKMLPLLLALPAIKRGHVRSYQWWSMLILLYLAEGLVRATSDTGLSRQLAWLEAGLAALAFGGILLFVKKWRTQQS